MELRAIARQYTNEAIQALVAALGDDKTRVPAAIALLDRGYGRPAQAITGADGESPIQIQVVTGIDRE